ncbi:hypothetical protein Mbo2_005 [Rhodococcus phage Mbo2]|uniref:Uncharacterized protein n=1 Tax=Rhodococcus phage Mbo2 TaxID=2936911 RepID=A0A9E7IFK9_9CAUD|nr:hypothetical protein Mbo2_005 [Rhodococcus phage Mbo2]
MNPIDSLVAPVTSLAFKVTAQVLRRMADAMDTAGATPTPSTPPPAPEIHYHFHAAPEQRPLFGKKRAS